jgi:hypothetical protein
MSPLIRAGERAWAATGMGLSAAAGQLVNEQFEPDLHPVPLRWRRPRELDV